MRVLHVTSGNMYGGVETFLTTLVHEADEAPGMRSDFAICYDGRFRTELERVDRSPHRLPSPRLSQPHTIRRARRALRDLIEREAYDVVICHQPWACVMFASVVRAAGLPVVLWIHMAGDGRHWLERCCRLTRPDVVLCNSRFTAARTKRWLPGATVAQVYYPVTSPSGASRRSRTTVREELETPAGDIVIVQVSRLEPWKGQHVLLAALEPLVDVPGWTCWIVGGPQRRSENAYFAELRSLAASAGIEPRIRFLGERPDVPSILGAADLFCQLNTAPEPFGLVFVEALSAGLPIVSTEIGGALEIVDLTCGLMTAPGDVPAATETLRRLIADSNLRARLGAEARRRADDLCNAARQMRRIQRALATTCVTSHPVPASAPETDPG